MTKEDMLVLIRSVAVPQDVEHGMGHAYDLGVEWERERVEKILLYWGDHRKSIAGELMDILSDVRIGSEYP